MKTTQVLFQGVDRDTKASFKAACAKRKTTMKKVLVSSMEKFIKEEQQQKPK